MEIFVYQACSFSTDRPGLYGFSARRETLAFSEKAAGVEARQRAFTLIELLVVIAIIAILAAILLPVLNAARLRSYQITNINNLRQLMIAFKMYNTDNNGWFPENLSESTDGEGSSGTWSLPYKSWVAGVEKYNGQSDNTNIAMLVNPQETQLALYLPNPAVYRSPGDQSKSGPPNGLAGPPRIRSYSMNCAVGCSDAAGDPEPQSPLNDLTGLTYDTFTKESMVVGGMGPADLWIMTEENPDSIDDGYFTVSMPNGNVGEWRNYPSKLEGNASGFSFADGHAEIHHWVQPQDIATTTYLSYIGTSTTVALKDPDLGWLNVHTTVLAP